MKSTSAIVDMYGETCSISRTRNISVYRSVNMNCLSVGSLPKNLFKIHISGIDICTQATIGEISGCGCSPVVIILKMAAAAVLVGGGISSSENRFTTGMPLVAGNSAVTRAAYYLLPEDSDVHVQSVQCDTVTHSNRTKQIERMPVGHCSFSNFST